MLKFWFNLDDKIRYLFVGGFNFLVSYLIYSLFCILFGVSFYQFALALAWGLSSVVSFTTQKFLVFNTSNGNWFKEYLKCCTTWAISYVVNAVLLEIFVKGLKLNVFLAQIAATFSAAIVTYILFKKFAFKSNSKKL